MGGKAKWRKLKQVVGPAPQGSQAPAKQHFKKERTKTRDAKRRRMGDGGEEEDDEADATADGSKKEPKSTKDSSTRSSSKKGQEHVKGRSQVQSKAAAKPSETDAAAEQKTETSQTKAPDLIQESNGHGEPPEVLVTDLDKEFDTTAAEGLEKPTSEDVMKEEIRQATEEEPDAKEIKEGDPADQTKTDTLESPSKEIAKELTPTQKSTQTDAVNMNNVDKPVKFFISDDSDSDTAIFVDANQGALNGANGQPQENAVTSPTKQADIAINAVIDVGDESTVEVTVEGQDIEVGIEEATRSQVDGGEAIDGESTAVTQLIDVEPSESPKISPVQRARFLPSLAQPVKTETQKMHGNLRRHGQSRLPFDPLAEGDNVSRSSASDSVDTVSVTRSSVSDLADQDNISKTSTSESADPQDGQRKYSTSDSVDLDTTSVTSESIEHETVSKVSFTESAEQETMTMSESADAASKMSTTVESVDRSTRGSISASESAEPDATSRTSVSESAEGHSKTSYSEYEEAEGITRTSASESGEPDSTSRTSVSESAEFDGTSRTSVSESAEEQSKTSASVTGTSTSATGEYVTSKSSVSYSSEFDAESLSSTADLLTPKEEVSLTADGKTEQGLDDSSKIEKESPTLTSDTFQEKIEDRPSSPAWEELNLEDNMQPIEEGVITEEEPPEKADKKETEPDAESLFFSLYPEYQPGEINENQDAAQDVTAGNPKVLCFRGQTKEQSETQEEIYMAAEKSGIKEGRNKGSVTGKIHQLQRKLSTQKKPEREDKEVAESEGPAAQQAGTSSPEQQDTAEQKSEGSPKEGGSEPSPDTPGGKSLSDVLDGTPPASTAPTSDAEKAEHAIGKKTDDLVCLAGQLREGIDKLADVAEVAVENVIELGQTEAKLSEPISEAEQEAMDGENKLEGNAKDRKTFVGKARDWIKGVTRMGGKKEDSNGKTNDKPEAKKTEAASADESENKTNGNGTKDGKQPSPDQEESPAVGAEASEEEKQSGESDSTVTKDNGISLDEQVTETNGGETTSKKDAEATEDTTETEQEKAETEATKESPTDTCQGEEDEKPEEPESKEEGLFDIVGPEEELSDTVFKDDTVDEAGKGKDSDDTEVPDMKTEESAGTEEEKIASPDKVSLTEAIETTEQSSVTVENGNAGEDKGENQDTEDAGTKESEPQFVSAEEGNETEAMPNTQGEKVEVLQETTEKRRKSSKDEKSRRRRHDKSKSKSPHTEGEKEEKASRKDKDGKSVGKKRRHRKRTKSQEEPLQATDEPRPEDVPLPPDDFEAEPSPERKAKADDLSGREGEPPPTEKKKVSSKSRERKHSRKSEEKSGEAPEHKRHSRSKREKSHDSKSEKKDKEKLEKGSKEMIESPREKLQTEGEVQPSDWSPRVDRKDRKSSRKSSDRKKDGYSTERTKIPKEKKDDAEKQSSETAPDQVCDDEPAPTSPKPVKKKSKKPPELSLTITEPRDDTPIPSPKSLSQGFKLGAGEDQTSQDKQEPLLETLTFPPGVSKPLSPLPPAKELKFPPGVSQPLSPLPKKAPATKHIPAPLVLKPESDLIVPPSPLNTLTFPEGVSKPISPLPKKIPQPIPKPISSSLDSDKPLPYPAKPVSPLKQLHFPEGIPKPVSPFTKKPQESAFSKFSSAPKAPDITDKDSKAEPVEGDAPVAKDTAEVPPIKQTITKKPKPRITIPKPEDASLQTGPTSLEPSKPSSPFTLKFPEGISKPVSPDPQKGQQPVFKLDEKTEKLSPEPEPVLDSTKKDLPMKIPAKPVSPLKIIKFPEGISIPVSPTPEKETKSLFKPAPTKPIPPALEIPKTDETPESSTSQEKKVDTPQSAPSVSQVATSGTETLTVLTFPAGVSKPISPMPQKTKFPSDIFKTTQPLTKSASSMESLKTTPSAETPPSPTCKPNETIKAPLIPSDFFKTVHPGEKPPSLLRTKTVSPAKEIAKTESDTSKIYSPGHTSSLKTFKFPEGVSMPLSPIPPKAKASESQSQTQKEPTESKIPITTSQERTTIFTFSHFPRTNEATKVGVPASPTLQKGKLSEPISPSPIKIKHTVDFPSDVFPCTKAHSPLIKSASSPTKAPLPSPKFGSSVTQVSSTYMKDSPPLPKIPSPLTQTPPALPKSEDVTATEESLTSVSPSPKTDTKFPKSILATRLKISPDTTSSPEKSPRTPSETKSTISQTHLTYSEVSKRFTPSPRLPDEICKEITATPPMTPPPEPEQPSSPTSTPKEKSTKAPSAQIQTSEVRSAARYSRGEAKSSKSTPPSSESSSIAKDKSESTSESKADSVREIRRLRDLHQAEDDSHSAKDGAQSPRSGCDSPSKKLRRRKRR
ncbi:platelet binding protein GspB-like [Palaemon carinicauda]|uniref:platelet binding protein GspB-like n=1 Tax=Palaemon carinicauda TaxID=392227 RepID=UPI0035B5FB10